MLLRRVLLAASGPTGDSITVNLTTKNLSSVQNSPDTAVCGLRVLSDGTLQTRQGDSSAPWVTDADEWGLPRGSYGADHEIELTSSAGTYPSGPTGWNNISTTRTWELTSTSGAKDFTGVLRIRRLGSILDNATITMDSTVNSAVVALNNKNINGIAVDESASAAIRLLADGTLQTRAGGTGFPFVTDPDEWALPRLSSNGALFEVRFSGSGTANPTGPSIGSWHQLNVTRTWDLIAIAPGVSQDFTGTMEIRPVGGSVVATATMFLTATSLIDPGGS